MLETNMAIRTFINGSTVLFYKPEKNLNFRPDLKVNEINPQKLLVKNLE